MDVDVFRSVIVVLITSIAGSILREPLQSSEVIKMLLAHVCSVVQKNSRNNIGRTYFVACSEAPLLSLVDIDLGQHNSNFVFLEQCETEKLSYKKSPEC
jgi:hypothetical protein